ncbi:hypothetical protein TNCV_2245311 [Trichonephila clavipes]|nr:hypothetical protein TNCV_2245311 [Trichonephila clavipes]
MKVLPVPGWWPMKQLAVRVHFLRYGGLLDDWSVEGALSIYVNGLQTYMCHVEVLQIPGHCGVTGHEFADHLAKKGASIQQTTRKAVPFTISKRIVKKKMNDLSSSQYAERNSNKIWCNNHKDLAMWPRRKEVAEFRLTTGHDCLLKHLHVAQSPTCTLCYFREDMDADHIRRYSALKGSFLSDFYWQDRDLLGS